MGSDHGCPLWILLNGTFGCIVGTANKGGYLTLCASSVSHG